MNDQPLVSIIINNYNYGCFVADAIDSAVAQTYENCEVIVVDDGSTDDSMDTIARYENIIHPISKENGGQGSAVNAGFDASHGDIVFFLDSDDILLPEAAECVLPFFCDPTITKVHWPMEMVNEDAQSLGKVFPGQLLADGDLREVAFRLGPTNLLSAPMSGNAWSRLFLNRVLPLNENLYTHGADTPLFELAPFFGVLKRLDKPLTRYRHHGTNFSTSMEAESRVRREVRFYENYTVLLKEHAQLSGIQINFIEWENNSWWHRQLAAFNEIKKLPGAGSPLILIDDATWEIGSIAGRPRRYFIERAGQFYGSPRDDAEAIKELERARQAGAALLVFAWPSFWWLEHYEGFLEFLRGRYKCVLENDRIVAFDLRGEVPK